ncbi:porin family protein [Aequorivita capsosiphonis]|uniref:porin family protein n=1 Tax=Aequorivita capsosiphonis TaxID=487317 RepID=UPI0004149A61|nr:porin family protein [Aequorivita capsosiphonis]
MRKLIAAVMIMFMGTTAFSQIDIDLGIKAGINFSNIRDLDALNLQYKKGLQAGVFVGINFSEKFGVQADLLYSEQGATITKANGRFDLTYINLPIVFKYYLVEGEGLSFQIGPQFGYLIDSDLRAVYQGVGITAEANDLDISGVAGFGYEFLDGFQVEGRIHLGFTDITDDPRARGTHKFASVVLGYSFL